MNFSKHNRLIIVFLFISFVLSVSAQDDEAILPVVGDVPLASKIWVSTDEDDETQAVIQGEVGAVFPNAFVVVQNLYTGDREIVSSTSNGEFTASLYGRDQTPYWVAAFQNFPSDEAINDAMGVTVYGEGEENTFYVESDLGGNVPRYRIWGEFLRMTESAGEVYGLSVEMETTDNFQLFSDLEFRLDIAGTSTAVPARDILQLENLIQFGTELTFDQRSSPEQVAFMSGYVRVADGEWEPWESSPLLGLAEQSPSDFTVILPIQPSMMTHVNTENYLEWGLMMDLLHHGARGVLPIIHEVPDAPYPVALQGQLDVIPPDHYSLVPDLLTPTNRITISGYWSGSIQYSIISPSGLEQIKSEIVQVQSPLSRSNVTLQLDDPQLSNYPFDAYGDYRISIRVSLIVNHIEYVSEHDYEIRVAEPLVLMPSTRMGTPLEVGKPVALSGYVVPPVPAKVSVLFSTYRDDVPVSIQSLNTVVTANSYGYFTILPEQIKDSQTYRVSYIATYEDEQGRLWSSEDIIADGNIYLESDTVLAHGKRGLNGYDGTQQAWFDTTVYPDDDRNAGRQPYFPYYAGDIAYVPDAIDGGIAPALSNIADDLDTRIAVISPNGLMRHVWRTESPDDISFNGDDTFNQQVGTGIDGIRAGDYAFLFGGVSVGDESAIYGALMVVEDEDAPARVLSPFLDKLTIFGQEVYMFFLPTGVRPAQVLELGETLSIVGQVAPTLPAEVGVTVTSPSGQKIQFEDVANAVGYFYSADNDFPLDEIGIWHIDIAMTYRGETSAGQLERPYPEGHLAYDVYVVPPDNPPLDEAEFMTETTKTNTIYSLTIPEGWMDVRAFATVTTPSWILAQEELTVFPAGTSYVFNPTQLARDYPNVELLETADGNHVADVVTLTLAMTGIDADGSPAIRTRTYTILHDVTYSTDGMSDQ